MANPRIAVYPGSFDPVTNGHLDILNRALLVFDQIIVALAENPRKQPIFSVDERAEFIREALKEKSRVSFDAFDGLLVQFCRSKNATCIVRGLRAMADFEYEFQFAHMNRRLDPEVDSVFFMTDERNHYVSSSLVKEVASLGGDVEGLVPPSVASALKNHFSKSHSTK